MLLKELQNRQPDGLLQRSWVAASVSGVADAEIRTGCLLRGGWNADLDEELEPAPAEQPAAPAPAGPNWMRDLDLAAAISLEDGPLDDDEEMDDFGDEDDDVEFEDDEDDFDDEDDESDFDDDDDDDDFDDEEDDKEL